MQRPRENYNWGYSPFGNPVGSVRAACHGLMRAVSYGEAVSSDSPGLSRRKPRLPWDGVAEITNTPKGLRRSSAA